MKINLFDGRWSMNYLSEINAFNDWCEKHYLPMESQFLWYKLMAKNNRLGWCEWVSVDNLELMSILKIKREATVIDIRNKLIESGLVEVIKGKKGIPNQYKMIPLSKLKVQSVVNTAVESVVNTAVESVVNTAVVSVAETVDLNKQNKTKLNNKKKDNKENPQTDIADEKFISSETVKKANDYERQFEEIYAVYPRKQGKQEALRHFVNYVLLGADINAIKQGVSKYALYCKKHRTEQQYINMISTFFSKRMWEDDWSIIEPDTCSDNQISQIERIPDGNEILDNLFKEYEEKGIPIPEIKGPFG